MLKVRCTTSELEGDDFVGLRFENNQPKVVFPRGTMAPETVWAYACT